MWGGDISNNILFNSIKDAKTYIINGISRDHKKCGIMRAEGVNGYRAWLKLVQKTNPAIADPQIHQRTSAIFYGKLI